MHVSQLGPPRRPRTKAYWAKILRAAREAREASRASRTKIRGQRKHPRRHGRAPDRERQSLLAFVSPKKTRKQYRAVAAVLRKFKTLEDAIKAGVLTRDK